VGLEASELLHMAALAFRTVWFVLIVSAASAALAVPYLTLQ
jgi:hypothetical protein